MVEADKKSIMEYRYLGNSGLKVSALSYGNMANVVQADSQKLTTETVKRLLEYGVNFFDTAEFYGYGAAETLLGQAFKDLDVKREEIVVSTKIFFNVGINGQGLCRKHVIEGTKNSLKRLQLDYVDVLFAHRPDTDTPLEETCRAFSWLIDQGKAFYWGTSEWPADAISEAILLCQKLNLHAPITEQPQYNMLVRDRFEREYRPLFERHGYGTTVWSPLAKGILAGKYNDGNVPAESTILKYGEVWSEHLLRQYLSPQKKEYTVKILKTLESIAQELGYSQVQVALAWLLASRDVSTVMMGISRLEQIDENMKALELYKKWDKTIEDKIEKALGNTPDPVINFKSFAPKAQRREIAVFGTKN